jgi:hypothetical protein
MSAKRIKVILDTNLWISFLISRNLFQLDSRIKNGTVQLVFSQELLSEFIAVASRPVFRKYFSNDDILNIIEYIDNEGIVVEVKSKVSACRDSKDNFLLALAKDSQADYLITGDKDLLSLKTFANTLIVTFNQFLHE